MFIGGKGFRRYSAATHNIVVDGNSIAAYVGGTLTGQGLATTIQNSPALQGSGIVVQGFATGGHAFDAAVGTNDMMGGMQQILDAHVPNKTNILFFDEFTNQIYGENNTAEQAITAMQAYMAAVSVGNRRWQFVTFTTIPRGVSDSRNLVLEQVNTLLLNNYHTYGLNQVIDRRCMGSPWRMTGYTQADFDAISLYYTATERSAANGGSGGNVNIHTHPSDLGYALQRSQLDMALRRVGYWR